MKHAETGRQKKESYNGNYMKIGKEGEKVVKKWLRKKYPNCKIKDVSNDRTFYKDDIDIQLKYENKKGKTIRATIEIKTCTWLGTTENILFEVLRIYPNRHTEALFSTGWITRCKAKWLYYYAPNRKNKKGEIQPAIYIAKFEKIREIIQKLAKKNEDLMESLKKISTDREKITWSLVLPFKEFEHIFTIFELRRLRCKT